MCAQESLIALDVENKEKKGAKLFLTHTNNRFLFIVYDYINFINIMVKVTLYSQRKTFPHQKISIKLFPHKAFHTQNIISNHFRPILCG